MMVTSIGRKKPKEAEVIFKKVALKFFLVIKIIPKAIKTKKSKRAGTLKRKANEKRIPDKNQINKDILFVLSLPIELKTIKKPPIIGKSMKFSALAILPSNIGKLIKIAKTILGRTVSQRFF